MLERVSESGLHSITHNKSQLIPSRSRITHSNKSELVRWACIQPNQPRCNSSQEPRQIEDSAHHEKRQKDEDNGVHDEFLARRQDIGRKCDFILIIHQLDLPAGSAEEGGSLALA